LFKNSKMIKIIIKKIPFTQWKVYKKIRLEALRKEPLAFGSSFEEEKNLSAKEWKKRIKSTLFAFSEKKPVGMIVYNFHPRKKLKHTASIYGVYVTKKCRRGGVGKKLMQAAFSQILKKRGIVKINLGVTPEQKAAITLYKSLGFKIVGKLKKDMKIKNKFYDHFIMEKMI